MIRSSRAAAAAVAMMALATSALAPSSSSSSSVPPFDDASCLVYQNKSQNCEQNCGSCFNPGGRAGVICQGPSTGYYCSTDGPQGGLPNSMAYACMDWTFQSASMRAAEAAFNAEGHLPSPVCVPCVCGHVCVRTPRGTAWHAKGVYTRFPSCVDDSR